MSFERGLSDFSPCLFRFRISSQKPSFFGGDPGGPKLSTPGLSDDDKIAILGGTAAKLLGIN
jgi:hypothetical protein